MQNKVYIISNHNNQPNISRVPDQNGVSQAWCIVEIHHSGGKPLICKKDADLLWNRSSRQRDFNRPPFHCEFMACIVLNIHIFLPSKMQTYSHRMFSLLPLPRRLSLQKIHGSKLMIQFDQVELATKCGIANWRSLCSTVFNSKMSWKYAPAFKQSLG